MWRFGEAFKLKKLTKKAHDLIRIRILRNMNALLENFIKTRKRTVQICEPLTVEDYIPQPVPFASPPKWHLAHTTWFFEEMILKKHFEGYEEYHSDFGFLFNSYYNSVGNRTFRANRGNITRPGVEGVYQYRNYVDEHMKTLLELSNNDSITELTALGLNHEQQHQELLITDFKYSFGHNPIFPVYKAKSSLIGSKNIQSGWVSIQEGVYEVGYDGNEFCFDNELGRHKTYIQNFEISKALVTNGEFIEFIENGGYTNFNYWLDEGWSWVNENRISSPLYWHKIDNNWCQYTLEGLKKIDKEAVVCHVSFYEANAFATWKGMRLPTEFEWEVASEKIDWGVRWEWTNSAYLAYPGFKIASGAVGEYNGKFMINQMVLRGSSVATSNGHSRASYRNFFQPHFQWQFSGIRLVK